MAISENIIYLILVTMPLTTICLWIVFITKKFIFKNNRGNKFFLSILILMTIYSTISQIQYSNFLEERKNKRLYTKRGCMNSGEFWNEERKICQSLLSKEVVERHANEDFKAVLEGNSPIHALFDRTKPLLADGGTTYYQGAGYTLEIRKRLKEQGYEYGPIVTFEKTKENGEEKVISQLKYYSSQEIKKLLDKGAN